MMVSWSKINYSWKNTLTDILVSIIWYNSDILVGKKPIFYQKCYEKGIIKIHDILNANNQFLSYNEFYRRYGHTIDGLIEAIPPDYKTIIRNNAFNDNEVITFHGRLIQKDLSSRTLYFEFITRDDILSKTAAKWKKKLQTPRICCKYNRVI